MSKKANRRHEETKGEDTKGEIIGGEKKEVKDKTMMSGEMR